jgi:hypothetical protein
MKTLLPLVLALSSLPAQAATYYVNSASGNDSHDGLSRSTPWKTLSKVQNMSAGFQPGDRVLFRAGFTYPGTLTLTGLHGTGAQPIRLGRYGYGKNPAFDGSLPITGWSVHAGKIWKATVPACAGNTQLVAVYRDGQFLGMGREPDAHEGTGWLTNDVDHGFAAKFLIEDEQLGGLYPANHWKGAEVVARTREWLLDVATVSSHSGKTLQLSPDTPLTYGINAGYGYFFRHALGTLDQEGEWYHQGSTQTLYLYSTTSPSNSKVEFACQSTLLKVSNSSHLIIQGLSFQKSLQTAVILSNVDHLAFMDNQVLLSARNGLEATGADSLRLGHNVFEQTQNNALSVVANNASIHDNGIHGTGLTEGMGAKGNGQYIAARLSGRNNLFAYNTVTNSGYNAIHFGGAHAVISQNLVDAFNVTKTDGGGIYTFDNTETGSWIYKNIVLNGVELAQGLPERTYGKIRGLYSDGAGSFNTWEANSVFNCAEGILNHQGSHERFTGNTVVGSHTHSLRISWDDGHTRDEPSRGNTLTGNLFVPQDDAFAIVRAWSQYPDVREFGVIDSNRHVVPLRSSNVLTPLLYSVEANTVPSLHLTQRSIQGAVYGSHDTLSPVSQQRFGQLTPLGAVLTQNATMDAAYDNNTNLGREGVSSSASFSVRKITSGGLDGSTMRCEFTSPAATDKGMLVHKKISVVKGQLYRVRLSVRGSVPATLEFKFRTGSGGTVHTVQPLLADSSRTNHVFLFRAAETTSEGRAIIDFTVGDGTVDLDNFDISAVTATEKSFNDFVQFKYNATKAEVQLPLSGGWVDASGAALPTVLTLKPFESKVLFKTP